MGIIRGKMETTISLSKSTCYFMKSGKCSLTVIGDHFVSPGGKLAANDLLYCPRLYKTMQAKTQEKPVVILPCGCGHAEVVSGHQRACIAARTGMSVPAQIPAEWEERTACSLCDGQITFESQNTGGIRIVTIKAVVDTGEEEIVEESVTNEK